MNKKCFVAIGLVSVMCLVCFMSIFAWAVPGVINYQGKLTNASDCVLTGTYQIQFLLYETETGGTALWDEVQSTNVDNGLFTVRLGAVVSFPVGLFESDSLYLETVILNPDTGLWETLTPRQQLTSAAYALKADHAATAASASHAAAADSATEASHATTADSATSATSATNATDATNATNATNWTGSGGGTSAAPKVDWANNANSATNAINATNATNATNAGYAATAGNADTIDDKHASEFLDTSGETQTKTGGLNVNGNVGIGTESPNEKLTVAGTIQSTVGGFKFPDGTVQTSAASLNKESYIEFFSFKSPFELRVLN